MSRKLSVGDWVEVRSREEILKTLDKQGRLEGMPFMPEMAGFCGKRFRVYRRAHKTCDTIDGYKSRRLEAAVHLEGTRCDGLAHGGCQAECLLFWHQAWLKGSEDNGSTVKPGNHGGCTMEDVTAATRLSPSDSATPAYACQATLLRDFTQPLPWWSPGQYVEDYTSGNVGLGQIVRGFIYMTYHGLTRIRGLGRALRWFYDITAGLRRGFPYPRRWGRIPMGERTPGVALNLEPGELVRVKSYQEILATCDEGLRNRGLKFDAELVPYCGGTYRVLKRVTRIINEHNGTLIEMKTPSIILESVVCQARYSECRLFCPRAIFAYWREIWLERVSPATAPGKPSPPA